MTDIVKRLRKGDPCGDCKRDRCACVIMEEAADEITRLTAEVEAAHRREACAADLAREWEQHCKTAEAEITRLRALISKEKPDAEV